jgi:hypothetical protein
MMVIKMMTEVVALMMMTCLLFQVNIPAQRQVLNRQPTQA